MSNLLETFNSVDKIENKYEEKKKKNIELNKIKLESISNIVSKEKLRDVQYTTLKDIANALRHTFGPKGSNTVILSGNDKDTLVANYSKDGHKVLKHILYSDAIELSIQTQLVDITHHVEKEVGDGTTSAVLLSNEIFGKLCDWDDEESASPYEINREFINVINMIQDKIMSHKRDFTLDDVYDLTMISTNGNKEIASALKSIYDQFGLDVYIDTTISNTTDNQIKIMDGLTLDEGYSDTGYVNTNNGKSSIRDARVYAFADPVDTPEMISLFERIIYENIMIPASGESEYVPTVILSPKLSRDMSDLIGKLVDYLYSFDSQNMKTQKPPILVVTNIGPNLDKYMDICRLCGCKMIRKYIDPEIQKNDIEKGVAPTPETITSFCGYAELVEADISTTKFINPKEMFTGEYDEETGMPIKSATYNNMLSFLEAELETSIANNEDITDQYKLRKRIQSLKANMVEFQVGGITISDRDSVKDLVEDAVKNCRTASENGVGYAANFEGFRASLEVYEDIKNMKDDENKEIKLKLCNILINAYENVLLSLYTTIYSKTKASEILDESIKSGMPINLTNNEFDGKVITSISTDIKILEGISKIISIMFTSNQALVQVPALNKYR